MSVSLNPKKQQSTLWKMMQFFVGHESDVSSPISPSPLTTADQSAEHSSPNDSSQDQNSQILAEADKVCEELPTEAPRYSLAMARASRRRTTRNFATNTMEELQAQLLHMQDANANAMHGKRHSVRFADMPVPPAALQQQFPLLSKCSTSAPKAPRPQTEVQPSPGLRSDELTSDPLPSRPLRYSNAAPTASALNAQLPTLCNADSPTSSGALCEDTFLLDSPSLIDSGGRIPVSFDTSPHDSDLPLFESPGGMRDSKVRKVFPGTAATGARPSHQGHVLDRRITTRLPSKLGAAAAPMSRHSTHVRPATLSAARLHKSLPKPQPKPAWRAVGRASSASSSGSSCPPTRFTVSPSLRPGMCHQTTALAGQRDKKRPRESGMAERVGTTRVYPARSSAPSVVRKENIPPLRITKLSAPLRNAHHSQAPRPQHDQALARRSPNNPSSSSSSPKEASMVEDLMAKNAALQQQLNSMAVELQRYRRDAQKQACGKRNIR